MPDSKEKLFDHMDTRKAEEEYFSWLSSDVSPRVLKEITSSYRIVSSMLVQKKVLSQAICATTQIEQVETALRKVRMVFGSKKLRNTASKILELYLAFLREKEKIVQEDLTPEVETGEGWIRFDFSNAQMFERTEPVYCCIDGTVFQGKNWARILVAVVEREIEKQNPALKDLYIKPLYSNRANRVFLLKDCLDGLNCAQLSNGCWININHSIPRLMEIIQAFCLHCGYSEEQVVLYGAPKGKKKETAVERKPFDLQEAVILLDVYLLEKKNNLLRTEADAIASKRLRRFAERRGMIISDSFRSPMGLQNRIRSIAGIFEGIESVSAPGTEVFNLAVELYKNNNQVYQKILHDTEVSSDQTVEEMDKCTGRGFNMEKAEDALKNAGLQGLTLQELIEAVLPGAAVSSTKNAVDENKSIISMPGNRYVHVDNFVDMDEAEGILGRILSTHFSQFGGYSNNQLLFRAASQELSMFLNDNDCENIDAVYAISRYLFEKKAAAGHPYKFSWPHVFEREPDYPMTLRGLMIHLARSNNGILYEAEAKSYLQKTMLTYGGMSQLLQIGSSDTFLMYDDDRYFLSEALGIDDAWCLRLHDRMDDLFRKANVAYVIPRDISDAWLNTLPLLPQGLGWTRLLLQEVLNKYPAVGFKSISADLNQSLHTIAAAFVPADSPLQSFPDVVTLFMEERHTLPMRMPGEELRLELRNAGMLEAGEMIYALPKALDDYRFAWTDENKTVLIRGN